MNEGEQLSGSDVIKEWHKLYTPIYPFLQVVRHQLNHVTVPFFTIWL